MVALFCFCFCFYLGGLKIYCNYIMPIYLKECLKPHLAKVKFNCDEEIHKKLNDYELTKSFFNRYNTTLLIGKQGSGKLLY